MASWVDDVEYADEDEAGQLALGVPGEQRALPSLAAPPPEEVRAMFEGFGWSTTKGE